MGTPFPNPVIAAGGALVVPVIRSPNFSLSGQTGWAVFSDGSAYFFNVTATGAVTSNTVVVQGSGDGVFIYDGTPALGSLIVAIVSAPGTDKYGNSYSGPGIIISAPGTGNNEIQIRPDLNGIFIYKK